MVSATNAEPDRIAELLEEFARRARCSPALSIRNGRRAVVITERPGAAVPLRAVPADLRPRGRRTQEQAARRRGVQPRLRSGAGGGRLPHPRLADGDIVVRWADAVGIDPVPARRMAESMLVQPVDWVEAVTGIVGGSPAPAGFSIWARRHPDAGHRAGDPRTGRRYHPGRHRGGQRNLFTVGAAPEVGAPWSTYAPSVITLPDGSVKLPPSSPAHRDARRCCWPA